MKSSYEVTETAMRQRNVELLAVETRQSVGDVGPIYDTVFNSLRESAEIKDYVPVFAWRRTRAFLMER